MLGWASFMIIVSANNIQKQLVDACVLSEALEQWGYITKQIAVAINGEFVPRSRYGKQVLAESDCIDIVSPIQGG